MKRYCSGMYVRLAFAVAAHLEPEILIVDEVLAVGDAQFQKKCLGKMGEVAKQGRTVLFVSHNMQSILKLCTQGLCLEMGRVVNRGTTEEVVTSYHILVESAAVGPELAERRIGSGEYRYASRSPRNHPFFARKKKLSVFASSVADRITLKCISPL